jgi:SdpI/YfhL protein family
VTLAFPLLGLVSLVIGWPLAQRRIAPNRWYGVRVLSTLSSPAVWYEVNAVCGDELVRTGLVLLVVSLALRFVPRLPEIGYVAICLAVFLVGSIRATARSLRTAKRLAAGNTSGRACRR